MENVTRERGQVIANRDEEYPINTRYQFNLNQIKHTYKTQHSTWKREVGKWLFAIGTFGLGALYLWATTQVIREGEIGLRCDAKGNLILLPPGRHSNFPWESYESKPKSLSNDLIVLGPYKIITVQTGFVAKTFRNGNLEILPAGQHLITDAAHTIQKDVVFLSVKEEAKTLDDIIVVTSDNIELEIKAKVRYQIINPELVVSSIREIEKTIFEIAELNIAQNVSHHSLAEFVPTTVNADIPSEGDEENGEEEGETTGLDARVNLQEDDHASIHDIKLPTKGLSKILQESTRDIKRQFEAKGIKLLNIGITTWDYVNKDLAGKLGEGAVIQSQIRSKILAARQAAKIRAIEAKAESEAQRTIAEGQAAALEKVGNAHVGLAEKMKDTPLAWQLYQTQQQVNLVKYANRPNLFFNMGASGGVVPTLPIKEENSMTV